MAMAGCRSRCGFWLADLADGFELSRSILKSDIIMPHVDSEGRPHGPPRASGAGSTRWIPQKSARLRSSSSSTTCSRRCTNTRASGSRRRRCTRACGCSSRAFLRRGSDDDETEPVPEMVLINPEIARDGTETVEEWEGCLSIPDIRGRVPRARRIVVRAYDRQGKAIELRGQRLHRAGDPARDRSSRRRAVLRPDEVVRNVDIPRRVRPLLERAGSARER